MIELLWTFFNMKCIIKRKMVISKSAESLRRKAIGPVKWQPVATLRMHCLRRQCSFCFGMKRKLKQVSHIGGVDKQDG